MARGLRQFDLRILGEAPALVGVDEVGRGCLAGPVVAAAVRCEAAFYHTSWCRRRAPRVDDSKRLSPLQRAALVEAFAKPCREKQLHIAIGSASVGEIEAHNIHGATVLAMRRALEQLLGDGGLPLWQAGSLPVLVDGRDLRTLEVPHRGVVGGDRQSLAVALASIHAKEWRDARMRELDREHPQYGFVRHKGYGTREHLEALRRHGPCDHHRSRFLRHALTGPASTEGVQGSLFETVSPHMTVSCPARKGSDSV